MLLLDDQKNVHRYTEKRPWGHFDRFCQNDNSCTVKLLHVKPNEELSLQYHEKRNEFWRVLEGNPVIVIGDRITKAKAGAEFFIPHHTEHQIISQDYPVQILEISFGEFDEGDIIRIKDKYQRI